MFLTENILFHSHCALGGQAYNADLIIQQKRIMTKNDPIIEEEWAVQDK